MCVAVEVEVPLNGALCAETAPISDRIFKLLNDSGLVDIGSILTP